MALKHHLVGGQNATDDLKQVLVLTKNTEYTVHVFLANADKARALKHLQAMRVALSRLRNQAKRRGHPTPPFRIVNRGVELKHNGAVLVLQRETSSLYAYNIAVQGVKDVEQLLEGKKS